MIGWLIDWFINWLIDYLVDWFIDWSINLIAGWLSVGWMNYLKFGWIIDWWIDLMLVGRLVNWLVYPLFVCLIGWLICPLDVDGSVLSFTALIDTSLIFVLCYACPSVSSLEDGYTLEQAQRREPMAQYPNPGMTMRYNAYLQRPRQQIWLDTEFNLLAAPRLSPMLNKIVLY